MFRRRPPRRPPPGGPRRPLPPAARKAEQLFHQGRFEEAARRFAALAHEATQKGLWQPATQLHIRAVQSFLQADLVEPAMEHVRQALGAMRQAGRPVRTRTLFRRIVRELEQRGYHAQAEALRQEAAERLGAAPGPPVRRRARYRLPTNCPNCGAALKEEEYRRVRPDAVECTYCGSLVQAQAQEP